MSGNESEEDDSGTSASLDQKYPVAFSAETIVHEKKCIAFISSVETLARTYVPSVCPKPTCNQHVSLSSVQKGSASFLIWVSIVSRMSLIWKCCKGQGSKMLPKGRTHTHTPYWEQTKV